MTAIRYGNPSPRKTFTQFDPVMFPIAESANSEFLAAVILAKVSGNEVPSATNVIAVTKSSNPKTQPMSVATSDTTITTSPIAISALTKHAHPPAILGGGTTAKMTFHPIVAKCQSASVRLTSSIVTLFSPI